MRALPTNPKGIQCSLGMIREIQQETLPETQNFLNLTALQVQFGPALCSHSSDTERRSWMVFGGSAVIPILCQITCRNFTMKILKFAILFCLILYY